MITVENAEIIHRRLIQTFGGSYGIRDRGSLESALCRPFQTFDGAELYPSAADKAAALFESLIINHPFIDGNKRISYSLIRLVLLHHNFDIEAPPSEKFEFVIHAAEGRLNFDGIRKWILDHIKAIR